MLTRLDGASRVRQGQMVELWFGATQLQLFDDNTGRNLLAASDGAESPSPPAHVA